MSVARGGVHQEVRLVGQPAGEVGTTVGSTWRTTASISAGFKLVISGALDPLTMSSAI